MAQKFFFEKRLIGGWAVIAILHNYDMLIPYVEKPSKSIMMLISEKF